MVSTVTSRAIGLSLGWRLSVGSLSIRRRSLRELRPPPSVQRHASGVRLTGHPKSVCGCLSSHDNPEMNCLAIVYPEPCNRDRLSF